MATSAIKASRSDNMSFCKFVSVGNAFNTETATSLEAHIYSMNGETYTICIYRPYAIRILSAS